MQGARLAAGCLASKHVPHVLLDVWHGRVVWVSYAHVQIRGHGWATVWREQIGMHKEWLADHDAVGLGICQIRRYVVPCSYMAVAQDARPTAGLRCVQTLVVQGFDERTYVLELGRTSTPSIRCDMPSMQSNERRPSMGESLSKLVRICGRVTQADFGRYRDRTRL